VDEEGVDNDDELGLPIDRWWRHPSELNKGPSLPSNDPPPPSEMPVPITLLDPDADPLRHNPFQRRHLRLGMAVGASATMAALAVMTLAQTPRPQDEFALTVGNASVSAVSPLVDSPSASTFSAPSPAQTVMSTMAATGGVGTTLRTTLPLTTSLANPGPAQGREGSVVPDSVGDIVTAVAPSPPDEDGTDSGIASPGDASSADASDGGAGSTPPPSPGSGAPAGQADGTGGPARATNLARLEAAFTQSSGDSDALPDLYIAFQFTSSNSAGQNSDQTTPVRRVAIDMGADSNRPATGVTATSAVSRSPGTGLAGDGSVDPATDFTRMVFHELERAGVELHIEMHAPPAAGVLSIQQVRPNSAAHRFDLRSGDQLMTLDGHLVVPMEVDAMPPESGSPDVTERVTHQWDSDQPVQIEFARSDKFMPFPLSRPSQP